MSEKQIPFLQPLYLLKVLLGLSALGCLIILAQAASLSDLTERQRWYLFSALIAVAIAIVPFVGSIFRRMDELQQLMHKNACVTSLTLITSASAIIGILQESGLIPIFSQFWTLGGIVAIWGIQLMLADRTYK